MSFKVVKQSPGVTLAVPVVTESKGLISTCSGHSAHLLPDASGGEAGRGRVEGLPSGQTPPQGSFRSSG